VSEAVAVVLFVGITAYALFGGADFGAGFWDLVAGRGERADRARAVVDHSIAPVWEANHVWLIFVLVVLWTAFSQAFASIMLTLFVPLTLAAIGIVLRGASFAFRKEVLRESLRRKLLAAFAVSSVIVPFCMGAVAGTIASGRVPDGGTDADPWTVWINPSAILGGVLAVVVCSYLAAVYLVRDAERLGEPDVVEYFRRRAIVAAIATGVVSFAGIFVLLDDARYVFDGLVSRAAPLVALSAVIGITSLVLLLRGERRWARIVAAGAVVSIVLAWGVAQWPYLLPKSLEISDAAAPDATLASVLVVAALALVIVVPALVLLYVLDQRSIVEAEQAAPPP
jgi:cytochrome d ubiquinol oxidase subunit II